MFSIVVPVYNAETSLCKCIDSILAQTFIDFELLLIDDGSTDNSGIICDKYAENDGRIRVFHKMNGGVSSARNLGIENSTRQILMFADADDIVSSNWLASFFAHMHLVDECLIVSYANKITAEGELEKIIYSGIKGLLSKENFFCKGEYGYLWNRCFSLDIINKHSIRFDLSMACFEDEIFVLEYSEKIHSIYIIDSPTYSYYMPRSFHYKYLDSISFEKQFERYIRTKRYSLAASSILVDWMVMTLLKECANNKVKVKNIVVQLIKELGPDIQYVLGLKKGLMRMLRFTRNKIVWMDIMYLYILMYKTRIIR